MGKTADLTVVQKTIMTPFTRRRRHKHSFQRSCSQSAVSKLLTESWVKGKICTTNREKRSLMRMSENQFKNLVNFMRNGLRLGVKHQEHHTQTCRRNLATVVIRDVLPGLRRRRSGLLPSGPKSSFQMRASSFIYLETKVPRSGGRWRSS